MLSADDNMTELQNNIVILAPSVPIDAGTEFTIKLRLDNATNTSLHVIIRDARGAEMARARLETKADGTNETDDICIFAPKESGEYGLRAIVSSIGDDGEARDLVAADFSILVQTHTVHLSVFETPSAIPANSPFTIKLAARCSAGCNLGGQSLRIHEVTSENLYITQLGHERWPETDALYTCEAKLTAPVEAGSYSLQLIAEKWTLDLPHTTKILDLLLNCVEPPDCIINLQIVRFSDKIPIRGATVVAHPFRSMTDVNGMATLQVPKGTYEVLVSASRHLPASQLIEAVENILVTIELDADETRKSEDEKFGVGARAV